jgi:hypothetical protein
MRKLGLISVVLLLLGRSILKSFTIDGENMSLKKALTKTIYIPFTLLSLVTPNQDSHRLSNAGSLMHNQEQV